MTAQVKLWAIQPGDVDKSELVERAARICYRSEMASTVERRTAFLEKLAKRGHLSVFEHARYLSVENDNPHERYWKQRYGVNITPVPIQHNPNGDYFVISINARSWWEYGHRNPILEWVIDDTPMEYDDLSPAERLAHASATFEVSGISRACSHQMVRHRVMSFSQESQRYCDSGDWEPVVPPTIQTPEWAMRGFRRAMKTAKDTYRMLRRDWSIPKQDARFVLPNATPTRLMVTATFERWRHFLSLRLDKAAQWEIRGVAQGIHAALMGVEPELFGDL